MMNDINRKIIHALSKDGCITNTKLAQDLDINAATVAKRINAMVMENIFTIRGIPNPYKMVHGAHAVITLKVDLKKIKFVCAKLVDNPNISTVLTTFGRFDVLIIADFCNSEMLLNFVKNELSQTRGINEIDINFVSEIKKRSYGVFANDSATDNEFEQPDEIDQRLIQELEKDGRSDYSDLAKKLGISSATVSRRVSSLLEKTIIKIVAIPNPARFGFHTATFITLRADSDKVDDICAELHHYPEVHTIMTLINNYDIILGVHFSTSEIMHDFIVEKIAYMDGVLDIETIMRAGVKKALYVPDFPYLTGDLSGLPGKTPRRYNPQPIQRQ
jgi:Lrp/AsnC family transcriptional regulator for asnA, asnC and gidA